MEHYFQTGQSQEGATLLSLYARYHIDRGRYPRGIGGKLLGLLRALAPGIRRHQIVFPILPMSECLKLGGLASETDHEDIRRLMKAAFGEDLTGPNLVPAPEALREGQGTDPGEQTLDLILTKISQDALTRLSRPIDQARDSYRLDSVIVSSHETFFDILSSFYLHLLRHASSLTEPADADRLSGQAITLLERAFARHGSKNAALAEARSGVKGGMRFVLNRLTDAFIQQEREEYITFVLTTAIDPLGREAKASLMASLMKRLAPHLPPDIASEPPEHFIGAYEPLIRAYVASIDQIKTVFSTL